MPCPAKVGYMIGTGVMVGLPGQTLRDLAGDIVFFRDIKANMIGGCGRVGVGGCLVGWEGLTRSRLIG